MRSRAESIRIIQKALEPLNQKIFTDTIKLLTHQALPPNISGNSEETQKSISAYIKKEYRQYLRDNGFKDRIAKVSRRFVEKRNDQEIHDIANLCTRPGFEPFLKTIAHIPDLTSDIARSLIKDTEFKNFQMDLITESTQYANTGN